MAEFNADANWYFRQDGSSITAQQTDLEYVAAHELTHGLGFGSGLLQYRAVFGNFVQDGYLAPLPINATQGILLILTR